MAHPAPRLLLASALLSGCLLTEKLPEGTFTLAATDDFQGECESVAYHRGVGCMIACGAGGSPVLGVEQGILRFVGASARYVPATDDPFTAECGVATWQQCEANAFGGLACHEAQRPYCAVCTAAGVSLVGEGDQPDGRPLVPAAVLQASVLPSMLQGRFRAEPGSCLAACVAAVTGEPCGACASGEGCLDTGFNQICHPRGPREAGAPCRGHQDCASLRCGEGDARCE